MIRFKYEMSVAWQGRAGRRSGPGRPNPPTGQVKLASNGAGQPGRGGFATPMFQSRAYGP